MKLNKEEKEFIKAVKESDMTEQKKKNLIGMVYVNREFMDRIMNELRNSWGRWNENMDHRDNVFYNNIYYLYRLFYTKET